MSLEKILAHEPFLLTTITPTKGHDALFEKLLARGAARATDIENVMDQLADRLSTHNVVLASDNANLLSSVASWPGVLPIYVAPGGHPSLAEFSKITVSNLDELKHLFDNTLESLLGLLRLDVGAARSARETITDEFYRSVANAGGLYIFGAGTIGRQVLQECRRHDIAVQGFVDNNRTRHGQVEEGLAIKGPLNLDPKRDVIVVSAGNHASTISRQLADLGFVHIVNLSQFFFAAGSDGQPERGYLEDLAENRIRWIALSLMLGDNRSREVIDAVIRHRLTLDTSHLAQVKDGNIPQWFDPAFLRPSEQAVFVDGGAFDGDTAEAFRRLNGPAIRIHAFELDPEIAARASMRLASFPEVVVHAIGLSDRSEKLRYRRTGITDGRLDAAKGGDEFAEVACVDELVPEAVTFLKLDVEGAEAAAIIGATRQIQEHSPLIAMAVYHRPSDPWALPLRLSDLNAGYRFYMRHYTDVAFETVIYAVSGSVDQC